MGMSELWHQYVIMAGCYAARFRNGLARLRAGDEVPHCPSPSVTVAHGWLEDNSF